MRWLGCACIALALTLALSGCERVERLGSSDEDRINVALPVAADTLAAKQSLDALATSLSVDLAGLEDEYRARLKVRALQCGRGYTPSTLSSDDDIRAAVGDAACFTAADAALKQWLGQRRIGLLLAAPPLRPVPAKAPAMLLTTSLIQEANFADRAGVALLQSPKEYRILDLATGDTIRTGTLEGGEPITGLSPNGRLFVSRSGRDAVVRESETGDMLATFQDVSSWQVFWVGDVGAILPGENGGEPQFVDFSSGRESKVPMPVGVLERVVALPGTPLRYAVLGFHRQGVVELRRTAQGWNVALLSEAKVTSPTGWSRNTSGLTPDGRRFYGVAQQLKLIDLPSMAQTTATFDPMYLQGAAATPDPDRLLVWGFFRNAPGQGTSRYVYSISQRTLAAVDDKVLLSPRVIYIPTLRRNAVIDQSKITILDAIPTAAPMPISELIERRATELALLAPAQPQRAYSAAQGPVDIEAARAEFIARMLRQGAGPIPGQAPAAPAATASSVYPGPLGELARNADIEAVGVYQGGDVGKGRGVSARTGTVQVRVRRSARPVVLSLSAYEPVRWVLTVEPGAKLVAVLSSGYYEPEVLGAGTARVYRIGRHYAYKRGSQEFADLDGEVARWTGKRIGVFQGDYSGGSFVISN